MEQENPIILELQEYLGEEFEALPDEKREMLIAAYQKKRKTGFIYLWWFLNFHYLYVHKWWLFILFFVSLGGIGLWWLIDLFRLNTILKEYNANLAKN